MTDQRPTVRSAPVNFEGVGGLRLLGDAWGSSENRSIVFLHGGGQTRHSWGSTAKVLAEEGWHAVTVDLRGHGDSAWDPESDYHLDTFVGDVKAVIETLTVPPVLVGASLGGIAALLMLGENEHIPCKGLVLVDVTPRLELKGVTRILNFMRTWHVGFDSIEEAAAAVAAYNPHRTYSADISGLHKVLRKREDGRYYSHWDPEVIADRYILGEQEYARMRAAAASVTVPTLLVRGKETDVVSPQGVREFLEYVPHAQFVDVQGAGHMVAGDKNDIFSKAVLDFVRELD